MNSFTPVHHLMQGIFHSFAVPICFHMFPYVSNTHVSLRGSIGRGAHAVWVLGLFCRPFQLVWRQLRPFWGAKTSPICMCALFCFCNVFCHVPLFVGLLVSKFNCTILSPCLNRAMFLSWLYARVSVLCALPTLFACELAQGGPYTLALTLSSRGPIKK